MVNSIHPQFRDTAVSTLLRTDTQALYQFSSTSSDSGEISGTDTSPVIQGTKPAPGKKIYSNKPLDRDSSYAKILKTKKLLSKNSLSKAIEKSTTATVITIEDEHPITEQRPPDSSEIKIKTITEVSPKQSNVSDHVHENYEIIKNSNDWMLVVIILSLVSIGWIRMSYRRLLIENRKAVISLSDSKRLFEEKNTIALRVFMVLNLIFFVNISLFITQVFEHFNVGLWGIAGFPIFAVLLFTLLFLYLFRILAYKFTAFLFRINKLADEAIHHGFVINRFIGIVLVPFIVAIPFVSDPIAEYLIYGGIGSFVILYLLQLLRGLRLFLVNIPSVFYTILYLCAFEIAPVAVLIKFCLSIL